MLIREIISTCKKNSTGVNAWTKLPISDETTRDKVLYGNPNQECTGIMVTLFASIDVIKKAKQEGCNFIICHEALFWNHGDHTDWLSENETFILKTELLGDMCVWRNHDYIHSYINCGESFSDGIFYGLMIELGWRDNLVSAIERPRQFHFDKIPVKEFAESIMSKINLTGIKCMGDLDGYVENVYLAGHVDGRNDNEILQECEEKKIDTVLAMEITDYTLSEYIRDGAQLGLNKRVLAVGHFNTEEPGMKYFAEYLPSILGNDIKIKFMYSGDAYKFVIKK